MAARPKPPEEIQQPHAPSSSSSSAELAPVVDVLDGLSSPPAFPNAELLEAELAKVRGRLHDLERSDERTAAQVNELWQAHAELSRALQDGLQSNAAALDRLTAAIAKLSPSTAGG